MAGIVGVIANDSARYSLFSSCIDRLTLPEGWRKEWLIGGDWCGARNTLCQMVLDTDATHLWFMDDDHAFPPSMLTKLLAHDVFLVSPICLTRVHPFAPVQYTEHVGPNQYLPVPLSESPTEGLVEVMAGGCAGMLIHRGVIELIEPPWFEYSDRSEDIIFCEKARAAGFTLHADLGVRLGHITTAVVYPHAGEDGWQTGLTIGRDLNLIVETADEVAKSAAQEVWTWQLRRVITEELITQLLVPANQPINWEPGRSVPAGLLQWWVEDGTGFHEVGDPFRYVEEKV